MHLKAFNEKWTASSTHKGKSQQFISNPRVFLEVSTGGVLPVLDCYFP